MTHWSETPGSVAHLRDEIRRNPISLTSATLVSTVWTTELFLNHKTTCTSKERDAKQKALDARGTRYIQRAGKCLRHVQKARLGLMCATPADSALIACSIMHCDPKTKTRLEIECPPADHPSVHYVVWPDVFAVPQIAALGGKQWALTQCVLHNADAGCSPPQGRPFHLCDHWRRDGALTEQSILT